MICFYLYTVQKAPILEMSRGHPISAMLVRIPEVVARMIFTFSELAMIKDYSREENFYWMRLCLDRPR